MRLGSCKTSFIKPPVVLYYLFVVALIVSGFGIEFLCCLHLCMLSYFWLSSGN